MKAGPVITLACTCPWWGRTSALSIATGPGNYGRLARTVVVRLNGVQMRQAGQLVEGNPASAILSRAIPVARAHILLGEVAPARITVA